MRSHRLARTGAFALLAVWVLAAVPACRPDDPERLARQATAAWTARRFDESEAALARLARVRPLTLPERLLRAQVARDRGRIDEAVVALGEPPPNAPPAERALWLTSRGSLELARHRFRDAETLLREAAATDPTRSETYREWINLRALQGRTTELEMPFRALTRATTSALTFADLYLWTLGRREDVGPSELADELRLVIEADPDDRASRWALAENLRRLGRLEEASQVIDQAPADDPAAQALRARIALDQGQPDRALTLLGPEPDPPPLACADSLRLRARLALIQGDASAAARASKQALSLVPDDRDALRTQAQALRLTAGPGGDRAAAERLRELDRLEWLVQNARPPAERRNPATLARIAEACVALDRAELGRAWLRLALAHDPLDPALQKRLYQLDQPAR